MDIERWLNKEIDKITTKGVSKSAMASFIMDALAKAREQRIPAYELTVFLTNALFESSIKMIEDAWVECGCRYAEMVRRRRRFDELAIATSCPIQSPYETQKTQYPWGFKPHFPLVSSTRFPDEPEFG